MKKGFLFFYINLLFIGFCSAQIPHEVYINGLSGSQISEGQTISVSDQYLGNPSWAPEYITKESRVIVELKYDQTKLISFPSCTVKYTIELFDQNNVSLTLHNEQELVITSGTLQATDRSWIVYDEGLGSEYYKAVVTITEVSEAAPADVHLDVRIEKDRSYEEQGAAISLGNPIEKEYGIMISWAFAPGATSYDVEWLFYEKNPNTSALSPEIDFGAAYRINTVFNYYVLPKVFPEGRIVFRVRARGSDNYDGNPENIVEGVWSYDPIAGTPLSSLDNSLNKFDIDLQTATEQDKNWVYTASYSEDGKRQEGMAFFDGALKQRQSVSSAKSDEIMLVSETYYDYHARPVIQTLPAVEQTQGFAYFTNFNSSYGPSNYDDDNHYLAPTAVSSGTDLGDFYSEVTDGLAAFNSYLPNANGYPYSRTIYTPDPSGRVSMTTMAGVEMIAGSEHETRYFYSTPTQLELDRLFGSNVGESKYYAKEMIRDANRQISVSYKDLHGRVIATAISELQPESPYLKADNTSSPETVITDLMDKNILGIESSALAGGITVSVPGVYSFEYTLTPADLKVLCEASSSVISFSSRFDIYFYLTDQYGIRQDLVYVGTEGDYDVNNKQIIVSNDNAAQVSFTASLTDIGNYFVYKIAAPNNTDMISYVAVENHVVGCVEDVYVAPDPCPSCCEDQCTLRYKKQIGVNEYIYVDNYGNVISDPVIGEGLIAACQLECEGEASTDIETSLCELQYEAIKIDMSPGGQYFDNTVDEFIEDENGNLIENDNYNQNEFIAPFINPMVCSLYAMGLPETRIPEELWPDYLRDNWEDEYAERTIWYHPEYSAFYRHCVSSCGDVCYITEEQLLGSDMYEYWSFDGDMSTQTDDQAAFTAGYFFPLSDDVSTGTDPENFMINHQDYMYVEDLNTPNEVLSDEYILHLDLTCDLSYCENKGFAEIIQQYLTHFVKLSTGEYFSIWYVMDDPGSVASEIENPWEEADEEIYNLFLSLHNPNTGLLNTSNPNHISKIQLFSGIYQFYKQYVIYNNLDCDPDAECWGTNTWPSADLCLDNPHEHYNADQNGLSTGDDVHIPAGFALHFPKNAIYEAMGCDCSGNPSLFNLNSFADNQQTETCENNCFNNLEGWRDKLSDCTFNGNYDFDTHVAPALLYICENSCGQDNAFFGGDVLPSGMSYEIPNSSPVQYAYSFQDVVDYYYSPGCIAPQHPVYSCKWSCTCDLLQAVIEGLGGSPTNQQIAVRINELSGETFYNEYDVASWLSSCSDLIYNQTDCDQLENNLLYPSGLNGIPDVLVCDDGSDLTWADYIAQCIEDNLAAAEAEADATFDQNVAEYQQFIRDEYNTRVVSTIDGHETFTMTYDLGEYIYTLYYYDQAGNLVQTVPPEGVDLLDEDGTEMAKNHRDYPNDPAYYAVYPDHTIQTVYEYNTFQNVIRQTTPDGMTLNLQSGEHEVTRAVTNFYYDDNARLVVSQNAKQANHQTTPQYSFTQYDQYGRITKTGQVYSATAPYDYDPVQNHLGYIAYVDYETTWLGNNTTRDQIVFTQYDEPYSTTINGYFSAQGGQKNLRNRVASVFRDDNNDGNYDNAIHYNYDVHGNAQMVIRDIPALQPLSKHLNKMVYDYDLISGNVLSMTSLYGQTESLSHKYSYDADNRLHRVWTKTAAGIWETDAKYFYYATGALARTETGDKQVQGTDYIYTINGWLRAINSGELSEEFEPGNDAKASAANPNKLFGADAAGLTLGYFTSTGSNYELVNHNTDFEPTFGNTNNFNDTRKNLYNGNIAWSVHSITKPNGDPLLNEAHIYRYDQLNRLKTDQLWQNPTVPNPNQWSNIAATQKYFSEYMYDFNGNILNLSRNGDNLSNIEMDALTYNYQTNGIDPATTDDRRTNNLLLSYHDGQGYALRYDDDLDDFGLRFYPDDDGTWCFLYDEIGNLIQDQTNEIAGVEWDVLGKIKSITRTHTSTQPDLEFIYDPMGNRIGKIEKPRPGGSATTEVAWKYTWYTLDAQGQTLATSYMDYELVSGNTYQANYQIQEEYIYGSSRLGVLNTETTLPVKSRQFTSSGYNSDRRFIITQWSIEPIPPLGCMEHCDYPGSRTLGSKQYELTDHLGNVLATISDLKVYDDVTDLRFEADVISCQDYFPFGMLMTNRQESVINYRWGMNGQENDNEITGIPGTHTTATFWEYDTRLGRRWNLDPVLKQWESPYLCFSGNPVWFSDPAGDNSKKPDNWDVCYTSGTVTHTGEQGGNDAQHIRYVDENGNPIGSESMVIGSGFDVNMSQGFAQVTSDKGTDGKYNADATTNSVYFPSIMSSDYDPAQYESRPFNELMASTYITPGTASNANSQSGTGEAENSSSRLQNINNTLTLNGFGYTAFSLSGTKTTLGSNFKLYGTGWNGNGSVATFKLTKLAGAASYTLIGLNTFIDIGLSANGEQSWGVTGRNGLFTGFALLAGGWTGLAIGVGYYGLVQGGLFDGAPSVPIMKMNPSYMPSDNLKFVRP